MVRSHGGVHAAEGCKNMKNEIHLFKPLSAADVRALWHTSTFFAVIQAPDGQIRDVLLIGQHVTDDELERARERAHDRGLVMILSPPVHCASGQHLDRALDETIHTLDEDEKQARTRPQA